MLRYTKNGPIIMDDKYYFSYFDTSFRGLLESVFTIRVRPKNGFVQVSFSDSHDLLVAIRAACGVNIPLRVGWVFDSPRSANHARSCILSLDLENECFDVRLVLLLLEVLEIKLAELRIDAAAYVAKKRDFEKVHSFFRNPVDD